MFTDPILFLALDTFGRPLAGGQSSASARGRAIADGASVDDLDDVFLSGAPAVIADVAKYLDVPVAPGLGMGDLPPFTVAVAGLVGGLPVAVALDSETARTEAAEVLSGVEVEPGDVVVYCVTGTRATVLRFLRHLDSVNPLAGVDAIDASPAPVATDEARASV